MIMALAQIINDSKPHREDNAMPIDLSDPKYYENRELSWIKFNRRVLNEAVDKNVPLLEKLEFTAITSSNLDEFFMVRVASLKDMENAGVKKNRYCWYDSFTAVSSGGVGCP